MRDILEHELRDLPHPDLTYDRVPYIPVRLPITAVASASLRSSLFKKLKPSNERFKELEAVAVAGFKSANERCRTYKTPHCPFINELRWVLYQWLSPFTLSEALEEFEWMGPGASRGSCGKNSLYDKFFVNQFTTTRPSLYSLYVSTLNNSRIDAEFSRVRISGFYKLLPGSALSSVLKNDHTNRTICTEPSLNMLFQQAVGFQINKVLKRVFRYDEALQPDRNRELARRGSIYDTLATIDLKSASDMLSRELLSNILPDWFYQLLCYVRSPTTSYNGEVFPLYMMSSMGNGFTFPLQTLLFAAVVYTTARMENVKITKDFSFLCDTSIAVFGDDIICPVSIYDAVISNLELIGSIPNRSKSFSQGFFRESCGHDYYDGVNVRGVYIKTLDTPGSQCVAINRLSRFIAKHNLPVSLTALYKYGSDLYPFVPPFESDDAGIKVPYPPPGASKKSGFRYKRLVPKRKLRSIAWLDHNGDDDAQNTIGYLLSKIELEIAKGRVVDRTRDVSAYVLERSFTPFWAWVAPVFDYETMALRPPLESIPGLRTWLGYVERQI
jgi:hypothetical protein